MINRNRNRYIPINFVLRYTKFEHNSECSVCYTTFKFSGIYCTTLYSNVFFVQKQKKKWFLMCNGVTSISFLKFWCPTSRFLINEFLIKKNTCILLCVSCFSKLPFCFSIIYIYIYMFIFFRISTGGSALLVYHFARVFFIHCLTSY